MTDDHNPTTRSRLLDAAAAEFAENGVAGARVDAIARRAGVNKQLVYYYFESKLGLFEALLRQQLARPKDVPADEDPSTGERMALAARRHLGDRRYVRLLMWEALETEPDAPIAEAEGRADFYRAIIERIGETQRAGDLPDDLDPRQVLLSRVAQLMFPVAFPQLTRLITGTTIDDPAFVEARLHHLRRIHDITLT